AEGVVDAYDGNGLALASKSEARLVGGLEMRGYKPFLYGERAARRLGKCPSQHRQQEHEAGCKFHLVNLPQSAALGTGSRQEIAVFLLEPVRSPLKRQPGEGTGPTRHADLRGNLVGRVPPREEPDVFQQAVRARVLQPRPSVAPYCFTTSIAAAAGRPPPPWHGC